MYATTGLLQKMSNEQRWIVSGALSLLLQVSRACCLAPVRFVVTRTFTCVYVSRNLYLLSLLVVTIIHLCTIYSIWAQFVAEENYNSIILKIFHKCNVIVFLSCAVLNSDTRIRNYMMCFTNIKRVIKVLQNTEETNIKKWHVLIILFVSSGGLNFVLILPSLVSPTSFNHFTVLLMLEFTMASLYQQQFLFFALHINFSLKLIQQQLQKELANIINDGTQRGDLTTSSYNIPLKSINKVIDMIGWTETFLTNLRHTRRQDRAQRIRQIKDCYISTCDALRNLHSSDNVLLFLLIIYISVTMVLASYEIIQLLRQGDSSLLPKLFVHSLQFLLLIRQIIMLIEPCHVAHEKIAKIRLLVCEMMCYVSSESDPILIEMRAFFNQLVLNNISYTALGICNIRRPLFTSIIGVVTTILIMIFEF